MQPPPDQIERSPDVEQVDVGLGARGSCPCFAACGCGDHQGGGLDTLGCGLLTPPPWASLPGGEGFAPRIPTASRPLLLPLATLLATPISRVASLFFNSHNGLRRFCHSCRSATVVLTLTARHASACHGGSSHSAGSSFSGPLGNIVARVARAAKCPSPLGFLLATRPGGEWREWQGRT
jgi:hypothetical protein